MTDLKVRVQYIKEYLIQKNIIFYLAISWIVLGVVFFTAQGMQFGKAECVISIVVIFLCSIILLCYKLLEDKLHIFAALLILSLGCVSLFVQPILNIPDEQTHFARAEMVSRGSLYINPDEQEFDSIQSYIELRDQRNVPYTQSEVKGKKIDDTTKVVTHVAASNMTFLYFPQAIGVFVAKILELDVIWMLWLGRIFNLCWYAFLVFLSVKIAPKMKFLLLFMSMLPISIQQAASFSPDATINGLAFLLIGYFLSLYCKEDKEISRKEMLVFLILSILVTLSKVTNVFMAGLILLLPLQRFKSKKSMYFFKIIIITTVIFVGGGYYYYTTTFAPNLEAQAFLGELNVSSSAQIQYILHNFFKWIRDFGGAMINQSEEYIRMLSWFGCLDYKYPVLTIISVFIFGKLCSQDICINLGIFQKVLVFLMIVGIFSFSCLALYISWTPVGANYIDGIQGRYFIPAIAMVPLLFAKDKEIKFEHAGDCAALINMVGTMLIITACKYY